MQVYEKMTGSINWLQSVNFTVTDYDKYESDVVVLYTSQWLGYRPTHCNKTVCVAIATCHTSVFATFAGHFSKHFYSYNVPSTKPVRLTQVFVTIASRGQ